MNFDVYSWRKKLDATYLGIIFYNQIRGWRCEDHRDLHIVWIIQNLLVFKTPSKHLGIALSFSISCKEKRQFLDLTIFAIFISESFAPCKLELEETIAKKRCEYAVTTRKRRNIERGLTDRNYPNASWRPKGVLITHLHEHKVRFLRPHTAWWAGT